jgi:hypothetical protein
MLTSLTTAGPGLRMFMELHAGAATKSWAIQTCKASILSILTARYHMISYNRPAYTGRDKALSSDALQSN